MYNIAIVVALSQRDHGKMSKMFAYVIQSIHGGMTRKLATKARISKTIAVVQLSVSENKLELVVTVCGMCSILSLPSV